MGRGVAFLCRISMDDRDLEDMMTIVLFAGFFADILSKTCESVLRSQYTTYIFFKVPEYARGDSLGLKWPFNTVYTYNNATAIRCSEQDIG